MKDKNEKPFIFVTSDLKLLEITPTDETIDMDQLGEIFSKCIVVEANR